MKQFAVIAAIILLAMPTPAKACSGLFDCMFGWTDREEVRSAAQTEQARIDAQAAAERAEMHCNVIQCILGRSVALRSILCR